MSRSAGFYQSSATFRKGRPDFRAGKAPDHGPCRQQVMTASYGGKSKGHTPSAASIWRKDHRDLGSGYRAASQGRRVSRSLAPATDFWRQIHQATDLLQEADPQGHGPRRQVIWATGPRQQVLPAGLGVNKQLENHHGLCASSPGLTGPGAVHHTGSKQGFMQGHTIYQSHR